MLRAEPITATSSKIFNDDVAIGTVRATKISDGESYVFKFVARDLTGTQAAFDTFMEAADWLIIKTPEEREDGTRFSLIEID